MFLCIFAFLFFCPSVFCSLLCIFLCFRSFVFRPASLLFCLITSAATTTWRTAPAAQTTRTSNTKGRTRTTKTIKTTGTTRTTRETRETRTTTTAKEEHNRSCLCVPWGGRSAPLFLFWIKPYQGICMSIEHNLNMLSRLKRDIEIIEVCTICRLGSALTGYLADRAGGIIGGRIGDRSGEVTFSDPIEWGCSYPTIERTTTKEKCRLSNSTNPFCWWVSQFLIFETQFLLFKHHFCWSTRHFCRWKHAVCRWSANFAEPGGDVLRSHGRKHLEEGEGLGRAAGDRRRWLVMAGDGWWWLVANWADRIYGQISWDFCQQNWVYD